jgi:4-coumarate--CoA ligase
LLTILGQLYVNIMAPKLGFPVYIMKHFAYDQFLNLIQTHRITHLQVAPPILVMLSKRPETSKYDLSSVKSILCGAAPLSKELQNDVSQRLGVNIVQGWGMTEVTCGAIHVPGGRYDHSGSVGYLDPNCECKLLDDDGREVAPGQPGEIFVRGPNICLSYWRNDQATAESIDDQKWLKTGDVAVVKDNLFWIVDRKKELIKVNALQVAPAELEAALLEHEDVADAAVVGITLHGEEWPRAYVTLKEESRGKITKAQIQEWIKSRVAKHKQLVGGVRFIDEVPKLASGKIQRKVLREWAKRDAKEMEGTIKARL